MEICKYLKKKKPNKNNKKQQQQKTTKKHHFKFLLRFETFSNGRKMKEC